MRAVGLALAVSAEGHSRSPRGRRRHRYHARAGGLPASCVSLEGPVYRSTAYTRIGVPPLKRSGFVSSFSTPRGQTWAHMPQPTQEARFTSVLAIAYARTS